jgi:alpha-tubulin suppressor-like RCC1 family protein
VQCWGSGGYGKLGNGSTATRITPVSVTGLQTGTITQIKTGMNHSCALFSDSTMQCWGQNAWGALGNGSNTDSSTPVNVTGLQSGTITQITCGRQLTCALFSNSTVQCWGRQGQVGDGTTSTSYSTPVNVISLLSGSTLSQISSSVHTCLLYTNNAMQCFSSNGSGQQGYNSTTPSYSPVNVVNLNSGTISQIVTGYSHTCAFFSNYTAQCWGYNTDGELGNGSTTNSLVPSNVIF